jgi:flagellar biosynthetic protein FliP
MGPLMATAPGTVDDLTTQLTNGASTPINILVLLTLITLLPGLLLSVTGFMRILIVLGFVRNALGTPTMPPNQVLVGISLFLTLFVMSPTLSKINDTAIKPWRANEITQTQALERAQEPLRKFMFKQTRDSDLALFVKLAKLERPETRADIPTQVLIPAFVLSELKTAFQIGFLIFIPFLIIDMVVSATLMSMGMMMLPPVLISLPFKILLFVLVDGWHLLIEGLVNSFNP